MLEYEGSPRQHGPFFFTTQCFRHDGETNLVRSSGLCQCCGHCKGSLILERPCSGDGEDVLWVVDEGDSAVQVVMGGVLQCCGHGRGGARLMVCEVVM